MCTGGDGQGSSFHFVAHLVDRFRGRTHEPHPGVGARLREVRALGEKAVAGVDGVHVVFLEGSRNRRLTQLREWDSWLCPTTTSPTAPERADQGKGTAAAGQVKAAAAAAAAAISGSPNTSCY